MKKKLDVIDTEDDIQNKFSFSAHSSLTILNLDLKGLIVHLNMPFRGLDFNDLQGKAISSLMDPSCQGLINITITKVVKDKVQLSCETAITKNGETALFVMHFDPLMVKKEVAGILVILREITESKKALDALKESQEKEFESEANLKTVFDNTRIAYVLLDVDLKVIKFNEPAKLMTKELFKKVVTLNSNLRDYFPEELRIILSKNWDRALAGDTVEYEKEYLHEDGTYHWYDIVYLPVKDKNKKVVNLILKFQDITKRKSKEKQMLNFQEERFRFAIEGSNDGIWDWNISKNEVFFSLRWKKMLGYEDNDLKNEFKSWESNIHPEDKDRILNEVNTAFKNKNYIYEVEHRLKCKDGSYKWILARGKVIDWDGNKPLRMSGTHSDISERKAMEEQIAQNEKMLSIILETLPVIVFAKDIKNDFKFSLWNKQAEEVFGLKASQCIGKNDFDFFSKEDAEFYRRKDIEAINNTGILDIPHEIVESPKGPVHIHTLKTIVRDKEGEPLYLLGVSENISELKKINDTLKVSEERYRSLVENSPIIIMTIDKDEKVQFINFSGGKRAIEDIIGTSIYNYIAPDYHPLVKEAHKKVFSTKKIVTYETEGYDANGLKIWVQTHAGPILIGDEVIGLTLFTRDISDRIESEEKIKKSLKEKEILLQEVHHRVKNNLQIISSILNLQTRTIDDERVLELIKETRYRIMSMSFIHDLLYQTKDFTNIDFSKYLQNITSNIMNTYTLNKNIDLKLEIEPIFLNLDLAIPCGLIVNELLTNAFKYAFPAGRKGVIKVILKSNNNTVSLSVADNGVGINNKVNYQTTETLGFQLINSLIAQIDGELKYEHNNGTKFTVSFKA
jgi:hypothetical protein